MAYPKPFHRNWRKLVVRSNSGYNSWVYLTDKEYAENPHHYCLAFTLIQSEILSLFDYVEPSDKNLETYSFKINDLLVKICIEIEANFKAILRENTYTPVTKDGTIRTEEKWNITDYRKINATHHLDEYEIEFPYWRGENKSIKPFENWKTDQPLKWYQAYNSTKHNRSLNFEQGNFKNLLSAFTGLFALISSQFGTYGYSTGPSMLELGGENYFSGNIGIGNYLRISFPTNWKEEELYDFEWSKLKYESQKFNRIDYNSL